MLSTKRFGAFIAAWLFGAVMLTADQLVITDALERIQQRPCQRADAHRPGRDVTTPQLVKPVYPSYTASAMRAGIEGSNIVEVIVLPDGTVGNVTLIRSLDGKYGLDEAAITAAKQSLFKPGTKDGQAAAVCVTIQNAFNLGRRKSR